MLRGNRIQQFLLKGALYRLGIKLRKCYLLLCYKSAYPEISQLREMSWHLIAICILNFFRNLYISFSFKMNIKSCTRTCTFWLQWLTRWGRVTHICVGNLTIIGSDIGLSPGRRQAIIWTNAGILLIGPYGTNFSEFLIEILTFSFSKMSLKVSSAKWRPFVSASMS